MSSRKLIISSIVLAGLFGLPMTAQAGFDWTPAPQKAAPAPQGSTSGQGQMPMMKDGPLTPEPDAMPDATMDVPPVPAESVPVENVESQTLPPPGTFAEAEGEQETSPAQQAEDQPVELVETTAEDQGPVLEGFGKEIPLAIALRDIVPPQFAYSFAEERFAGLIVSWRGGKSWHDVLNETLANHGLTSTKAGNAIIIETIEAAKARQDAARKVQTVQDDTKPSMPVIKMGMTRTWKGRPGYTLKEVIGDWSRVANVELEWLSPYDYPINSAFNFDGTYEEAVRNLLAQYARETPRPRGRLYPNLPQGPSILLVN